MVAALFGLYAAAVTVGGAWRVVALAADMVVAAAALLGCVSLVMFTRELERFPGEARQELARRRDTVLTGVVAVLLLVATIARP